MSKFLLHTCCAPCGAQVIRELRDQGFEVTCFFYNPNIFPYQEYLIRKNEIRGYLDKLGVAVIESPYEIKKWFQAAKGLESEPERGRRCQVCYRLRLEETARQAVQNGYTFFGSTLSISPHKDAVSINMIGEEVAHQYGVNFLPADWKKKDGYKKSCQIARDENFYRQHYCGCIYSKNVEC